MQIPGVGVGLLEGWIVGVFEGRLVGIRVGLGVIVGRAVGRRVALGTRVGEISLVVGICSCCDVGRGIV